MRPDPNTMAFGGVATGSMNAMEDAMAATTISGSGSRPNPSPTPAISGIPRAAVAVLLVSSVKKTNTAAVAR